MKPPGYNKVLVTETHYNIATLLLAIGIIPITHIHSILILICIPIMYSNLICVILSSNETSLLSFN
jgi:hypothetical protein